MARPESLLYTPTHKKWYRNFSCLRSNGETPQTRPVEEERFSSSLEAQLFTVYYLLSPM